MKIEILYEDSNLMVINKPAGLSVHSSGKQEEKNVADWFLDKYPEVKDVGESMEVVIKGGQEVKINRSGIVHRLDKETSGVLILVKNQETFYFLKNQFQNHQIEKVYQAFVYGLVSDPKASLLTKKRGIINVPIGRSPKDIRMWTAGRGARDPLREAVTEYVVLQKFEDEKGEPFSFLEIFPKTGRTHQIRVHLRYLNHPIVSDPLYRGNKNLALGMNRLALHAKKLKFNLLSGELKEIEAPYPNDFELAIKKYLD